MVHRYADIVGHYHLLHVIVLQLEAPKAKCFKCSEMFTLEELRVHIRSCQQPINISSSDEDESPPLFSCRYGRGPGESSRASESSGVESTNNEASELV